MHDNELLRLKKWKQCTCELNLENERKKKTEKNIVLADKIDVCCIDRE